MLRTRGITVKFTRTAVSRLITISSEPGFENSNFAL